jgi:hypothetical protein
VLSFASSDSRLDYSTGGRDYSLRYNTTGKHWDLGHPTIGQWLPMQLPHPLSLFSRRYAPVFPNGIFLGGTLQSGAESMLATTTAASPPNGIYVAGDIILKKNPSAGGKIGWVCTSGGAKADAWVTATTYAVSNLPSDSSHVTNASKVYRVTTAGPGTSTVAPTHGSGSNAPGVDGYVWLYLNASSVPVFKEWGAIDA